MTRFIFKNIGVGDNKVSKVVDVEKIPGYSDINFAIEEIRVHVPKGTIELVPLVDSQPLLTGERFVIVHNGILGIGNLIISR